MTTRALDSSVAIACAVSAAQHERLCPRQVLGVRMGLAAGHALGLSLPRDDKRLLLLAETDGCVLDGVTAATGCTVGHRTLRIIDYGRVAVTAVNVETERAVRIVPRAGVRELAISFAGDDLPRYYAQVEGYQQMPEHDLLRVEPVALTFDLTALLGRRGTRVDCSRCGEEVLNGRELYVGEGAVCPGCQGGAYYQPCAG
ncbi:MAG: FmdE family protein [Dehalococcoidia bacterium]|nr:FmdE family protein [Dehalococcoidia bacterium]